MQLTSLSDYSLRVLIYCAVKDAPASLTEIAGAYDISRSHLVKAVGILEKSGFVMTKRGPKGGISLAHPAEDIVLGHVVRHTEASFTIVECFDPRANRCCIAGICSLEGVIAKAMNAFLETMDAYTLADVTKNKGALALQLGLRDILSEAS